jgi:hypothetical protein
MIRRARVQVVHGEVPDNPDSDPIAAALAERQRRKGERNVLILHCGVLTEFPMSVTILVLRN